MNDKDFESYKNQLWEQLKRKKQSRKKTDMDTQTLREHFDAYITNESVKEFPVEQKLEALLGILEELEEESKYKNKGGK